jgi:hypothetical protein
MSEPIWIEVETNGEGVQLVETLARHGIRGVSVTAGERFYVRIPASRERTPELLRDVAVAIERSRAGARRSELRLPTAGTDDVARLSSTLRLELERLGRSPLREVERLEREADAGVSPATPAILIAGMALSLWTFVALVVLTAVVVAHLAV